MKSSHPDHPCKVQVNLDAHPRTKWFSPRVQKPSQIRPPITTKSISSYTGIEWSLIPNTKIHWSWTTHTKWMSMWMVRLKRNDFRPAFWKKKNDHHTTTKSILSLNWNQVESDPAPWIHVDLDYPNKKHVHFHPHTKKKWFSGSIQVTSQFQPPTTTKSCPSLP